MQCNFYLCSVNCKTCPVVSCGARRPHTAFRGLRPRTREFRGFHPRTPTYFSLVRKVGKSTHGRRKPFDGVSHPCPPLPRRHKGGRKPPFGNPRITSKSLCSAVEAPLRAYEAGGESKEGAAAPSLVVVGEGSIREGPHRKGPSLM